MDQSITVIVESLITALGIGLLVGVERERHKGTGPNRGPAGIRSFALVSLLGSVSFLVGGIPTLLAGFLIIGILTVAAYVRSRTEDPGVTTEVAFMTTYLLGALAVRNATVAGALGVTVTILLASRTRLHQFVSQIITERELHDGLMLAAAALIVLPFTPDEVVGPYHVLNPRTLWELAVLVMSINALGYVALRFAGPKRGLEFAGFASGFISSAATIAAMAHRAAQHQRFERVAVAGAVLSSVSTIIQLTFIVGTINSQILHALALPFACAGAVAALYGAWFALHDGAHAAHEHQPPGRPFDPKIAVIFMMSIAVVFIISAALREHFGTLGLTLGATVTGFADTHAAAAGVAAISANGQITPSETIVPILLAMTANGCTKCVVALTTGRWSFARQVIPGVVLMTAAAWGGLIVAQLIGYN